MVLLLLVAKVDVTKFWHPRRAQSPEGILPCDASLQAEYVGECLDVAEVPLKKKGRRMDEGRLKKIIQAVHGSYCVHCVEAEDSMCRSCLPGEKKSKSEERRSDQTKEEKKILDDAEGATLLSMELVDNVLDGLEGIRDTKRSYSRLFEQ